MVVHKNIKLSGKVQNVGFRYYTHSKAKECNIRGFVKNMPDGSVYIEAEGEETDMEIFMKWCSTGPSWARVTEIQIQEAPLSHFEDFRIR